MTQAFIFSAIMTFMIPLVPMAFTSNASAVSSKNRVQPNHKNSEKIFELAVQGNLSALKKEKDLHVVNSSGETLLIAAAASGHLEMVKWLLTQGLDVNHTDLGGATALFYAVSSGENDIAKILLPGSSLEKKYGAHEEVISFELTRMGMSLLLDEVLRKKPTLTHETNTLGNTALHEAVLAAQSESAKTLLKHKVDAQKKNKKGQTAKDLVPLSEKANWKFLN